MARTRVTLVLDCGANVGQYGKMLRQAGYRARIVSFEPSTNAFEQLASVAAKDPLWECHRVALGARPGAGTIHVAANSVSSSLLPVTEESIAAEPACAFSHDENIVIERLDSLAERIYIDDEVIWLKIDVQGFELEVLRGSAGIIDRISAIELEMSTVPLYEGQPLVGDVLGHLQNLGFELVGCDPGFSDPVSGYMLQMDGVFVRRELPWASQSR